MTELLHSLVETSADSEGRAVILCAYIFPAECQVVPIVAVGTVAYTPVFPSGVRPGRQDIETKESLAPQLQHRVAVNEDKALWLFVHKCERRIVGREFLPRRPFLFYGPYVDTVACKAYGMDSVHCLFPHCKGEGWGILGNEGPDQLPCLNFAVWRNVQQGILSGSDVGRIY